MVTFVHEAGSSTAAVASFAQERRVQTVLGAAGGPLSRAAKNVSMLCRVPGPVDVGALTAAIRALVARHPALQYRFVARKDQVLLRRAVRDTPEFGCTVHDAVAGQDHEAVTGGAMREAVDVPFDVLGWPLLRAGVFPGTPSLVYLSVDHAVCDGYSATVAARDLEALYRGLVDGRPAELPPTGDFVAHSAAQRRRYADGPELDQAVDDMRSLLRGRPVEPEFPLPVTDWDATRGRYTVLDLLDAADTEQLARYCRAHRVSLYMMILAAFGVAARDVADCTEVGVLVAVHNRDATTRGIGWYANMLPLYFPTFTVDRFDDGVRMVRDRLMDVLAFAELPLSRLAGRLADAAHQGAGVRSPTCFVSFERNRPADSDGQRSGWAPLDLAPSYRMGYGLWAVQDGNGIRATTASPATRSGEPLLSRWEQRLAEVLTAVARR